MAERDELSQVVRQALSEVTGIYDTSEAEDLGLADAVLAAGYRLPRVVETADELNELPGASIVRDRLNVPWQKLITGVWVSWLVVSETSEGLVGGKRDPFTILWEGGE
ncbi:hypothetical protein [Arthrobacter sp. RCC_34]|uniref:hypothetical protein n=1 Tax=Arthrobacter sp. RCC_34 TaxID=3239230 RepID=UPI00352499A2